MGQSRPGDLLQQRSAFAEVRAIVGYRRLVPFPDSCTAAELVLTRSPRRRSPAPSEAREYFIIKTEGSPRQRGRAAGSPSSAGLFRCASAVAYGPLPGHPADLLRPHI